MAIVEIIGAPMSSPSTDQLIDALRPVQDPELHRSIVYLGMVRDVVIDKNGVVGLTVVLTIAGCPLRAEIQNRVNSALREGGDDGRPIAAVALAAQGHKVGIVDADIYGYSIPRMLGTDRDPVVIYNMLLPPEAWGVRCISIGYFVPEGQAVVWRGPMLHKALEQFLTDVFWDEPDFLLIDMPPGTGDIALSLSQYLPRAEVLVVTTPQLAAQKVAQLSAAMATKVNLPVRGIIENMSWFTGDDGVRYELFGSGGGQNLADELNLPLLPRFRL